MVYSDIKRFGLHNVLPKKKRYGSEKDKRIVKDAILNNKEFVKFALQNSNANYINEIVGRLIRFVIVCNEVYNESELE